MIQPFIYVALALFGASLGSFVAASVWRIRSRQLSEDKEQGRDYDKKEYAVLKKLLSKKTTQDRSVCLHCHKLLHWYELVPVVSWLVQKGRCRSCKKPIGRFEIMSELGLAAFFVLSYALWPTTLGAPLEVVHFIIWLIAGTIMALLFAYDAKWFLLPDAPMFALIAVGLGVTGVVAAGAPDPVGVIVSSAISVGILGGLYAMIYFGSKGRWVGLGDVILGAGLGLVLADWQLALVALFMANFIGCLIVIPLMATGKLKKNAHVPFGPLLIAGSIVAWFFGKAIIEWYLSSAGITF